MEGRLKKMLEDKGFGGDDPGAWLERAADICLVAAEYDNLVAPCAPEVRQWLRNAAEELSLLALET